MPGTAADARQASVTAWDATRSRVYSSGAAPDIGDTALAARTAAGASVLASGAAVAVVVAATSARIVHGNKMSDRGSGRGASSENVGCGRWCDGHRHGNNPGHCQWFHQG